MTTAATVDDELRIRLPDAKPGQVVIIESRETGGWTLSLAEEQRSSMPDIVKNLKPLSEEQAHKAYETPNEEFDALEHHCANLRQHVQEEEV